MSPQMRKPVGLTRQQRNCLEAIKSLQSESGLMPSTAELSEALGLCSKSGVHRLLVQLESRGVITRAARRARGIRLVESLCPHCGGALS